MKRNYIIAAFIAFTLIGCGPNADKTARSHQSLSGYDYIVISGSTLSLNDQFLSGEGEIGFVDPVGSISSNRNFLVEFVLDDGGFLVLKAFANNTLNGGVDVRIERSGDRVSVSASARKDKKPVFRELSNLDANAVIPLSIDVHNSETPSHVLIWPKDQRSPTDDNAIFNSDVDGVVSGNGVSVYWGLAFKGAKVWKVATDSPKFTH